MIFAATPQRRCWRCVSSAQVKGTLLLAKEGINGTIAGSRKGVDTVIAWLEQDARFASLDWKESFHWLRSHFIA